MKEINVKDIWSEITSDECFGRVFQLCVRSEDDIIYKFKNICDDQLDLIVRKYYNSFNENKIIRTTNVEFANKSSITDSVIKKYQTSCFIYDRLFYEKEYKLVGSPAGIIQSINLDEQTVCVSILDTKAGKAFDKSLSEDRVRVYYNADSELFVYEII